MNIYFSLSDMEEKVWAEVLLHQLHYQVDFWEIFTFYKDLEDTEDGLSCF